MEDSEINDLAARLEAANPPDVAVVKFLQHGGGPDESHMVANRAGYLRLAALFLRAAVAPHEKEDSAVVDIDSSDIIDEDSDVFFAWLERQEKFEKVEYKPSFWENLFPIGCIVFFLAAFALIIIGVGTVMGWLS